jgi:ABC-type transporter Mla subunit MlaD
MTIVLGSSVIVTTIASVSKSFFIYQEGMEGNSDSSGNTVSKSKKGLKDKESFVDNTEPETEPEPEPEPETETETETGTKTGTRRGRGRDTDTTTKEKTEGLSQLTPSLFNAIPNKDQMQKQLGQASDMEQAYDNLEKIMGKDNIQSISTDTKDLIKQQNDLIKQLKTMTPALNDAMSSIGNLDLSKLTNMFSSATKTLSEMKN